MIHMLSRFDLNGAASIEEFSESYSRLIAQMRAIELVETTGEIGRRVSDTPMDTDADTAPQYYVVMSFRDRRQLDDAYAYLETVNAADGAAHAAVNRAVTNSVFTCWQDLS